ncbi:MAG: phage tail tube protein [Phycisphaerae bacterium]
MGAPILSRQRLTGFAAETTQGTAVLQSALVAADFATPVFNSKITNSQPLAERQMQGSLSMLAGIPGAPAGKAEFETELFNATTPPFSSLLLACGFAASSGVYTPSTGIFQTATIYKYDGCTGIGGSSPAATRVLSLAGSMGTFKMSAKVGQTAKMEWSFDGIYGTSNTATIPASIVFSTVPPPRVVGITLTVGGVAYVIPEIEWDLGNKVEMRESVSAPSGYYTAVIVDRKPLFKVSPEALAFATQNWPAVFAAGTTLALDMVIGTVAGNIITIAAPALQIMKAPEDKDEKEVLYDDIEFGFVANGSAADSEYTVTFS